MNLVSFIKIQISFEVYSLEEGYKVRNYINEIASNLLLQII